MQLPSGKKTRKKQQIRSIQFFCDNFFLFEKNIMLSEVLIDIVETQIVWKNNWPEKYTTCSKRFQIGKKCEFNSEIWIIIIIIINTFKYANFIKKLLMESPLRRRTTAD